MPQGNTRPRTVTPQDQPIASPDNGLADILSRAGVIPFNPNTGGSPDLQTIIQGLLTPTPAPMPQKEGLLQTILASLGQGVAAATQNPALNQQIQTQQAQKFANQQNEREQSDRMNQIRQQFGLKLLDSQLGEQQDIAKETRNAAYRKEERIAAEQAAVREFNMQMTGKEQLENISQKNQIDVLNLKRIWDKEDQANANARFDKKEKQDLIEKKLDVQLGLVRSGLPVGIATSITDKWFKDEKLTPKEEAALTATAQRALRLASGGGGRRSSGGGSGKPGSLYETVITDGGTEGEGGSTTTRMVKAGLTNSQVGQIVKEHMAKDYVQLRDGSIVDKKSVRSNDILMDIVQIDHTLTPEEKEKFVAERVLPSAIRASMPRQAQPQQTSPAPKSYDPNEFQKKAQAFTNASQKAPSVFEKARYYQQQFDNALQSGDFTKEAVAREMAKMAQQLPQEDRMIVEGIVVRNTKRSSSKTGTKTKVQLKGNKTPEQMKKEMDEFLRKGAQQ